MNGLTPDDQAAAKRPVALVSRAVTLSVLGLDRPFPNVLRQVELLS